MTAEQLPEQTPLSPGVAGVAAHWAALGQMAAAARAANPEPEKAEKFKYQPECNKCRYKDSEIKSLKIAVDNLNAVVDDQASQIVDLQAKLEVVGPNAIQASFRDTIKRLQETEDNLRFNLERAEARAQQLEAWAREHHLATPAEATVYRRGEA